MNYYINILNIICIRCCFYEISCSSLKTLITLFTHLVVAFMRYFVHLVWIKRVGDHRRVVELWIWLTNQKQSPLSWSTFSVEENLRSLASRKAKESLHLPWTWIIYHGHGSNWRPSDHLLTLRARQWHVTPHPSKGRCILGDNQLRFGLQP